MLGSVVFSSPFQIHNLQTYAPSPSQILDGAMTSVSLTLDKLCGTAVSMFAFINKMGIYLSSKDKTAEIARRLLEEESTMGCPSLFPSEAACVPISTGLNVTSFSNCLFKFPVTYEVHLIPSGSIDWSNFRSYIQSEARQCLTNCISCFDSYPGSPQQRIGSENFTFIYTSRYIKGRIWEIVTMAPEDIYQWNKNAISMLMPRFLDKYDLDENFSKENLYVGLTCGAVVLTAIGLCGVVYWCNRTKGTNEEKKRLVEEYDKDDCVAAEIQQKSSEETLELSDHDDPSLANHSGDEEMVQLS